MPQDEIEVGKYHCMETVGVAVKEVRRKLPPPKASAYKQSSAWPHRPGGNNTVAVTGDFLKK